MVIRGNQDESVSDILKFARNQQIDWEQLELDIPSDFEVFRDFDQPAEPLRDLMDPELVFLGSAAEDDESGNDDVFVPQKEIELLDYELPEVQTEVIICGNGLPSDEDMQQGEFWEICSNTNERSEDCFTNSVSSGSYRTNESTSEESILSDSEVSVLTDLANATFIPCDRSSTASVTSHDFDYHMQDLSPSDSSKNSANQNALKQTLRSKIQSKRAEKGLDAIQVEFKAPPPEKLTAEEVERRTERRIRNRLAARKCRNKKRATCSGLENETKRLERRQTRLMKEVNKLRDERENLRDVIKIHRTVCPLMPDASKNDE